MSAYCEPDEVYTWGVNENAIANVNVDRLSAAIVAASAKIDSYLRSQFVLPLSAWDDQIRRCCAIIVGYDLISATRGYSPASEDKNDPIYTRYKDELAWLEQVRNGLVTPIVTDSGGGSGGSNGTGSDAVSSSTAVVASNTQRGWYSILAENERGPFTGGR